MTPQWTKGQLVVLGDRILTVERVTPSGMPVVQGTMFHADGTSRTTAGRWRARARLLPLTPELEAEINERAAVRELLPRWSKAYKAVEANMPGFGHAASITADQLRRICEAIESILQEPQA